MYPRRKHPKLPGYGYSLPGYYFVTICVANRAPILGDVANEEAHLSDIGQIAADCRRALPVRFAGLDLGEWVVMPNHVHGILGWRDGTSIRLGEVVRTFKAAATHAARSSGHGLTWQRGYYERVLRSDTALEAITE